VAFDEGPTSDNVENENPIEAYIDSSISIIDGISRGFIVMLVPVIGVSIAIGIVMLIMKTPMKIIGGVE